MLRQLSASFGWLAFSSRPRRHIAFAVRRITLPLRSLIIIYITEEYEYSFISVILQKNEDISLHRLHFIGY